MNTLQDFIRRNRGGIKELTIRSRLPQIEEYFSGDVPDYVLDRLETEPNYDFVYENLKSHNWKKFAETLSEKFPCIHRYEKYNEHDDSEITLVRLFMKDYHDNVELVHYSKDGKYIELDTGIKNVFDFFNYFPTHMFFNENDTVEIIAEPVYTEQISQSELNRCHSKFYHVTSKSNAAKIETSGLRCKYPESANDYRTYPARIYLFSSLEKAKKYIDNVVDRSSNNDYVIFEIDFNGMKQPNIYKDYVMEDDAAYFTYTNIPLSMIKEIERG